MNVSSPNPDRSNERNLEPEHVQPSPEGEARGYDRDGLGFVLDVPVRLSVEIGRRSMRIAELLRLGPGSVLELNKVSGEPLDIYVNDRLVARGDAVVVGERYGVRLSEILVNEQDQADGLEGLL
jgi:flagellar motor switch protein FliN